MNIEAARRIHLETFRKVFEVAHPQPFGGGVGESDGNRGVQWNAWVGQRGDSPVIGCVGVNLEGLTYDNWPIDRLIERELGRFSLFNIMNEVKRPEVIMIRWTRDIWANQRTRIELQPLLYARLSDLSADGWRSALVEAQGCVNREKDRRRRAWQMTTVNGVAKDREVSPHLQLISDLWREGPPPKADLEEQMRNARQQLGPVYRNMGDVSKKV